MRRRHASINDLPIAEADRKYHWPLGRSVAGLMAIPARATSACSRPDAPRRR